LSSERSTNLSQQALLARSQRVLVLDIRGMKTITEEAQKEPFLSGYTGSATTFELVEKEIEERWGKTEAKKYDPYTNTLTFAKWAMLGYRVKKGERSIRSITFVEQKDKDGNITKRFRKSVCLFYYLQVEKVSV